VQRRVARYEWGMARRALGPAAPLVATALLSVAAWLSWQSVPVLFPGPPSEPVVVDCRKWLAKPRAFGPWVELRNCRLDAGLAVTRRWRSLDKNAPTRTMSVFLPLMPNDDTERGDVRAVVATHEAELMKLLDTLTPLSLPEAKRFLDEHGERLNALLEPRRIRGVVLETPTPEAQAVLHELGHDDAIVFEQGKTPDTSNEKLQLAAAGVFVALAVAVMLARAPA